MKKITDEERPMATHFSGKASRALLFFLMLPAVGRCLAAEAVDAAGTAQEYGKR